MNIRSIPLLEISRWFLLGLLVYAPWAYGATRPWAKESLAWALLALAPIFVGGLLQRHRWPRVPVPVMATTLLLLSQGWLMTWNAWQKFDEPTFTFALIPQWLPGWPGNVDSSWCGQAMLMISGLAVALWIVCDLSAHPTWRRRFAWTIALVGTSIAVLGLLQRATDAKEIFWGNANIAGGTFFATYRYHANAGAFINLVLPFVALALIWTFREGTRGIGRTFWPLALLLVGASAFVNISRAAMSISALILMVLAVWQFGSLLQKKQKHWSVAWGIPIAIVLAVVSLSWAFGLQRTFNKWTSGDLLANQRLVVYETILTEMLPGTGNFGTGAGTFQITFPFYTQAVSEKIPGIWKYAHQDYLQTLLEWGWLGGGLFAILFFGGLVIGIWRLARYRRMLPFETRSLLFVALLSLGGVMLHSMGDFPLQIASLRLYAVCALGLCWSLGQSARPQRRNLAGDAYHGAPETLPHNAETPSSGKIPLASLCFPTLFFLSGCAVHESPFALSVQQHMSQKQARALELHAQEMEADRQTKADEALIRQQEAAATPNLSETPDILPSLPPPSSAHK